jgi:hypothetical protein
MDDVNDLYLELDDYLINPMSFSELIEETVHRVKHRYHLHWRYQTANAGEIDDIGE